MSHPTMILPAPARRARRTAAVVATVALASLGVTLAPGPAADAGTKRRFVPATVTVTACTPDAGYTQCLRFGYSGADQTFEVPAVVETGATLKVEVWGAGGGGTGSYFFEGAGGGGGYTSGTVTVGADRSYVVVVGQGGLDNSTATTYGGGGAGGNSTIDGASGGGFSGLFSDTPAAGTAILMAGGGGGGSPGTDQSQAGGGGGTTGTEDALPAETGRSGTQGAGGAAATSTDGCTLNPTAGGALAGGTGGSGVSSNEEGGGGGGGGWYGGGGGHCAGDSVQNGGGGGGSGYVSTATGVSGTMTAGAIATLSSPGVGGQGGASGGASSPQYVAGVGKGGNAWSDADADGGNGMVVIQWAASLPALTSTGEAGSPQSVVVPLAAGETLSLVDGDTTVLSLTMPGKGTYVADPATGTITFTPLPGFVGPVTEVIYRVTADGLTFAEGDYAATVTPRVDPPAPPPPTPPAPPVVPTFTG